MMTYQMASCPSASVFKHCPLTVFQIRLEEMSEKAMTRRMRSVHQSIKRARNNQSSITVEVDCCNVVQVCVESFHTLSWKIIGW